MDNRFVLFILKRYLRFDKDQPFIFVSALLAFLGIMVGVMVLIVAMAIMNGFDREFESKLFVMNYPLTIYPKMRSSVNEKLLKSLEREFPTFKFSPYITSQVIYKKGNHLEGGMVFGVDFKKELAINPILKKGIKKIPQGFDIVVGKELYDSFYLIPDEKIFLIFTQSSPLGFSLSPVFKRFRVVGKFHSGLLAYDKAYSYTTLEAMQKVLHMKRGVYSGIHLFSPNPQEDIKKLRAFLGDKAGVIGWWQQNGNFFSALALEKRALFIVLMLIICVASLNIVSSLLMMVMNRRKEIALMLALGASVKEVEAIFFRLGGFIGGLGISVGALLGLVLNYLLAHFDIIKLPADVYGTSHLPVELSLIDFISIIVGAAVIVLFSSIYPAKRATKVRVIDVLRNE